MKSTDFWLLYVYVEHESKKLYILVMCKICVNSLQLAYFAFLCKSHMLLNVWMLIFTLLTQRALEYLLGHVVFSHT